MSFLLGSYVLAARADDDSFRTWYSRDGQTLEAKLMEDGSSFVLLENKAGKTLRIGKQFLSDPDIQYLKEQSKAKSITLIRGPDTLITASFEDFLKEQGYSITVLSSAELKTDFLDQTKLLILVSSFQPPADESLAAFLLALKKTRVPVIALADSARIVLRQLELSIGQNNMASSETRIIPSIPGHPVFQGPQQISTSNGEMALYNKVQNGFSILLAAVPAYMRPIAQTFDRANSYPVVLEDNRFLFWGFPGSPDVMSAEGRALFLNLVDYLVRGQKQDVAAVPAQPPPPGIKAPVVAPQPGPVASPSSYPSAPVVYETGQTPPGPVKDFKSCRLFFTSKESRASSAFFGFEASMGLRSDQIRVSKDASTWYNYHQEDGVVYYTPRIKITARNKPIPPQSLLTVEYYSRPSSAGGSARNLEAVQHIPIPGIERGKDLMVDAGELGTYRFTYKSTDYKQVSGKELYGFIVSLFGSDGALLFQQASQQSLVDLATAQPKPAMNQASQR
ncbi:MAG TPA: hypothetical protein DCZ95_04165 [Verrucomicrobia bacterium]|nr:MAG: hypothetical protein A2X46_15250 [Lentisphaerae bacterium GWF2_57_35]HBA83270.1 hypothetical protein [Verrucomicrobiota bacterium]